MKQLFFEALEVRALMAATITRVVEPFSFTSPAQLVQKAEPMNMTVSGTDTSLTIANSQRTNGVIKEQSTGTGTGLITGEQYQFQSSATLIQNFSAAGDTGTTQLVVHSQLVTEGGQTIREVYISHFMILPNGQERSFEKVI